MQLPVDEDLPFGNVARQVRDRMGDVVVRHGENGDLGDGAVAAFDAASSLVDGGQVRVHVTRVTAATGHFFASGGNLAQGVAVRGEVGEDDEDVLLELVGVVFGGREGKTRSDDTFDPANFVGRSPLRLEGSCKYVRGIVGQVQEQSDALHASVFFKVFGEEATRF